MTCATWVILGSTPLLLWSQWRTTDGWRDAISGSVAALVGMVPEGLVLLTSISFLFAAVKLARRQVLVQELPAVDGLARVDVECLDKTGTLTEGDITFDALHPLGHHRTDQVESALAAVVDDPEANATSKAIAEALPPPEGWLRTGDVPFSSARKWSAAGFRDQGWWVLRRVLRMAVPAGVVNRRHDLRHVHGRQPREGAHGGAPDRGHRRSARRGPVAAGRARPGASTSPSPSR